MGGALSIGTKKKKPDVEIPLSSLRWTPEHVASAIEGVPEFTGFLLPGEKKGEAPLPWEVGRLAWAEGATDDGRFSYAGQFKRGRENGYGVADWSDGNAFHGAWVDGVRAGNGASSLDGTVNFRGVFTEGERHGRGIEVRVGEEDDEGFLPTLEGTWEHGVLVGEAIAGRTRKSVTGEVHVIWRDNVVQYSDGKVDEGTEAEKFSAKQHQTLVDKFQDAQVPTLLHVSVSLCVRCARVSHVDGGACRNSALGGRSASRGRRGTDLPEREQVNPDSNLKY